MSDEKGKVYEFNALIQKHDGMNAAYIEFPYDVEKEFGTKGQVKVQVKFDNVEYRGSLAKMGMSRHCIGLTKEIRSAINKQPGDTVIVFLKRDEEQRLVVVPQDMGELLDRNEEARSIFTGLSYTHRKEYVTWIENAKKHETRQKRLQKTIEMLVTGVKHP